MMKKYAVILSGCGFKDGSEIHESVMCLLAVKESGHTYQCFAPDIPQNRVVNHLTGQIMEQERRSVLVESARIARGNISSLATLDVKQFHGLIMPGGAGAAWNYSSWGKEGGTCWIDPLLKQIVLSFHAEKKPIGAVCIAPAIIATIFQTVIPLKLTLGTNQESLNQLKVLGMQAISCSAQDVVCDTKEKLFSTPAYMENAELHHIYQGIKTLISQVILASA